MVGFIDSGVGGLNVMLSCYKSLNEDFVFLCDNKNSPYGNKTKKKLLVATKNNIDYLIKHYNVDMVVLACNTLSFTIYDDIKKLYNIKIIPMKFNGEKINKLNKDVLFFATKNTIQNNNLIKNKLNENGYKSLYIKDLAKKIDDNLFYLENIEKILKKHLKNKKYNNIKSIVLGCTHFLTIKNQIKNCFENNILFYDNISEVVDIVKNNITEKNTKSFHIALTDYNYAKYVELKAYVYKNLRNN